MIQVLYDEHDGKANGVRVRDCMTSDEYDIHAKSIIFAGGPFTDSMRLLENKDSKPAVNGAAGTHIVLPGYYSPPDIGMLDINTSDGRFLFFLPWQGSVLVGTTDRKGPPVSMLWCGEKVSSSSYFFFIFLQRVSVSCLFFFLTCISCPRFLSSLSSSILQIPLNAKTHL